MLFSALSHGHCDLESIIKQDLEVEPPGQEASLAHNTDDGVEALGVVRHEVQQLAATRPLTVS